MAQNNRNSNRDVAEKVVNRILQLVDEGKPLPWIKPWNTEVNTVTVVDGVKTITVYPHAWNPAVNANYLLDLYKIIAKCEADVYSIEVNSEKPLNAPIVIKSLDGNQALLLPVHKSSDR